MRDFPFQSILLVLRVVAAGAGTESQRIALHKKFNRYAHSALSTPHSGIKADRTAEEVESRKTNPTRANLDCHKPCCGIAFNSPRASMGSKNEATDRGCSLRAAGCLYRDRPKGSQRTRGSQARQQKMRISEIKANG
jgi:hypothetical protein